MVTFLYPALLGTLLALPLIWYFLRVMPPAPKRIYFPAARLLVGLIPQEHTPSKTPWWILLLRILMAGLIIIALARPVMNPAGTLGTHNAVRLIMDNSWPSAQTWDLQLAEATEIITKAEREKRDVYILTSAPISGEKKPYQSGLLTAVEARSILRGLAPVPWPADYKIINEMISQNSGQKDKYSFWISHGLDEGGINALAESLVKQGGLQIITPAPEKNPLLLRPPKPKSTLSSKKENETYVQIDIDGPSSIMQNQKISLQAQGQNSNILDIQTVSLSPANLPKTVDFEIMDTLRGELTQFRISGRKGAGAIFLLDDQSKKRDIGIAGTAEKSESASLMDDAYYIKRALEPYANITQGEITDLINKNKPMIILPDVAAMPAETLNALENWVKDGGLLLRFSGPNMADGKGEQFLLPVALRSGGRSLSGAMTWEKPQTIAEFAENSPFYGLDIPQDLTIKQQILADPAQDLTNKIWAHLSDGTPLITASPLEKGLVVLIHTSAGPEWSDLALSGLYVNMLRRLSALSNGNFKSPVPLSNAALEPILVMDGYGALTPPSAGILPLPVKDAEKEIPNSFHPPGLYGHGGMQFALNIGTNLPKLKPIENLPSGATIRHYESRYEIDLMPAFLCAALVLFFLDWGVMIIIAGSIARIIPRKILTVLILFLFPQTAFADTQSDVHYASGLYLAYIKTGDPSLDQLSHNGLEKLGRILSQRTSVEPDGVAGLDPETDELSFFPIIYWPISTNQKQITDAALKNVQFYLDHGGTILFDTRDQNHDKSNYVTTQNTGALRRVISSLNIPPLSPIKEDHVLGRSFYLLKNYPGRLENGTIWIEDDGSNGRDGVSSVIIGSNDWVSAWAAYSERTGNFYDPTHQTTQQELAMRFGVNLVMYALTGNYKADQVHIPFILERLGK